jgi:MFS family permease
MSTTSSTSPNSKTPPSRRLKKITARHTSQIFKIKDRPLSGVPWAWMLITGLSTLAPLMAGYFRGEIAISIYGSLTGCLIGICDHRGTLRHRLLLATIGFLVCWGGFAIGLCVQQSLLGLLAVAVLIVYPLGLLGGKGAELERLLLFSGILFFISRYAVALSVSMMGRLSFYFCVAYVTGVLGILLSRVTLQKTAGEFVHVRVAVRQFFVSEVSRHFYAATFLFAIFCGIFLIEFFKIERGYWIAVTILLMMRPSRKEIIYRIVQRMFGTLLGVLVGEVLIVTHAPMAILVTGAFLCASFTPYVWHRNYWLVSFLITTFVIILLSIALHDHLNSSITVTRLEVTFYGCAVSLIAIGFARFVERLLKIEHPTGAK